MTEKLKKILIVIGAVFVSLAVVLFVLYKIFVTPNVKVALTLIEAKEDIKTSFNYYLNDDERDIVEYATNLSGESEYNLTFEKSPLFEGSSAVLTTEGNADESVSKLEFNSLISLDIYADKSNVLINLPVFDGGLKIPYGESLALSESDMTGLYGFLTLNNIDSDFFKTKKPELVDFILQADIKKNGSDKIEVGDSTKKADVYEIKLTEDDMIKLSQIIESYLSAKQTESDTDILNTLTEFAQNNTIYLKIRNYNLYEIGITGKDNHTVSFSAGANQFNSITYSVNGTAQITREKTSDKDSLTDVITLNGKQLLSLKREDGESSLAYDNGKTKVIINATGMNVSKDRLSYDNVKFSFGDNFVISGEYSLRKRTETTALNFSNTGKYLDVSNLVPDEWAGISDTITDLFENIPFF